MKKKITSRITCILLLVIVYGTVLGQNNEKIELAQEYDDKGEITKAKALYDELAGNKKNIPVIHSRYMRLLLDNGYVKEAEDYVDKVLKYYPENFIYRLDAGITYLRQGKDENAHKYFEDVIEEVKTDPYKVRIVASHFIKNELIEEAVEVYEAGRDTDSDVGQYALELANVYRRLNEKDKMIEEYLKYAEQDQSHVNYVKNVLQNVLTEEEDLLSLADKLFAYVQEYPDKQLYNELLIWVNLQQKNFYGAFIQAKAIDRRNRSEGEKVMEVAAIAMENQDYRNALKMYDYLIEKYPKSATYIIASRMKIKAREELVKTDYPVSQEEIVNLINDYQVFIDENMQSPVGTNNTTLEAMRSQALLYAFYLDEKEKAIEILQRVVDNSKAKRELKAMCKLDLGDIYLLIDQSWESTLLYSQVEKAHKEEPVGYEAKLRNAKLSYYKGEFSLAQEHLDVLKLATTREIANDAMSLSILIQNNTVLDTTDQAMKEYAGVELLLFQNNPNEAMFKLDSMLKSSPSHSLADEIHWLMAKITMQMGKFEESLEHLDVIEKSYNYDILGDDALYMKGKIYEEQLKEKDEAMEVYASFLKEYPGSIYVADVRKRFRALRGDFNVN
jgi:tetratricopeptide (TPR) repeat protein